MSDVTQRSSVLFYRSCLYISSIMRCSTHTITKMSLFFGAVAISTMALAVATNHWIIAWETTTPYVWTLLRIFLMVETIYLILVHGLQNIHSYYLTDTLVKKFKTAVLICVKSYPYTDIVVFLIYEYTVIVLRVTVASLSMQHAYPRKFFFKKNQQNSKVKENMIYALKLSLLLDKILVV